MRPRPLACEVVCRVVDNYGDAGVAWRLARQLALEHGMRSTLTIDDLGPLARLVPEVDSRHGSTVDGVTVRRGPDAATAWTPPDLVVDAFGGGLPPHWVDAMAACERPPAWAVLEYLSAEPWVDAAHLRASPEPRTGLARTYFCPGFTPSTGGLLRERDLLARRDAFARTDDARGATLRAIGVGDVGDARVVLVFAYPTPGLADLLDAWAEGDERTLALVPEGVAVDALDRFAGGRVPHPGAPLVRGALTVAALRFVPQRDFDALLWSCDAAIVRGEDSFVRAQWAALPFAWQAYPQERGAHQAKVAAFLDRHLAGAPGAPADAVRALHDALNRGDGPAMAGAWPAFAAAAPALAAHRRRWADALAQRRDLATGLVEWAQSRL